MNQTLIDRLTAAVREQFSGHGADHDFYHIERVVNMALYLQEREGGDRTVIAAAALLHDISDHKLNGGIMNDGGRVARMMLLEMGQPEAFTEQVAQIIDEVSFKGAQVEDKAHSLELQIVRDADRLDAMGAIGIARAFHYGGSRNRPFYVPGMPPVAHADFDTYVKSKTHTVNHFHEKLLLLQDRLHTATARKIGAERHRLMQDFVDAFYADWYFNDPTVNPQD